MSLNLDPTVARRRPRELEELVVSIVAAGEHDEQDWLEWKRELDLTSKAGQFAVSRTILALANRDPAVAQPFAHGLGYLVIGVEPGSVPGVPNLDTANLDDGVSRYTGDGPRWSAHRVPHNGVEVLVIVVEPPVAGDPPHPLCTTFQPSNGSGADGGTLYVRRGTKSRPATAEDVRMLTERALDGSEIEQALLDLERERDRERRSNQARLVSVDLFAAAGTREDGVQYHDIAERFANDSSGPIRRIRVGVSDSSGWLWGPQLAGTLRPAEQAVLNFRLVDEDYDEDLNAIIRFQDVHDCYWIADARHSVDQDSRDVSDWIHDGRRFAEQVKTLERQGSLSSTFASDSGIEAWADFLTATSRQEAP